MTQIEQLIADCKISRERVLADQSLPEPMRVEMADNVWPWLEAFGRAVKEEHDVLNAEIAVLLAEEGSVIEPELGASILGVLEVGRQIAGELEMRVKQGGDEVAKKRMLPMIRDFVRATHAVGEAVQAAMMEPGDDATEDGTEDEIPGEDGKEA